ncbi:bifunctional phosphoribosyl-AMP cyclohydrolase/phosphoribosyl-ATP diphosphatase HisIE [Lachnospiraceae bacterium ZAX-1]
MKYKNLVATLYLKDGKAVKGFNSQENAGDLTQLAKMYNDSGIDKLIVFDLSDSDMEHELNIQTIKELIRGIELPVCAGGNINRLEDIKKLIYAGCKQVLLNSAKPVTAKLAQEGSQRFGKEKMAASLQNVDILFKHRLIMEENLHEMYILNEEIIDAVANITDIPYTVMANRYHKEQWVEILEKDSITGIGGDYVNRSDTNVMELKAILAAEGIKIRKFESAIDWSMFHLNADNMIPVIVQDYQTLEVLMLAYMNQEAFEATITLGKMTYFSRSRSRLWTKGETSGHYQYLKSMTLDCDNDTILARVSQVGVACHTGSPTCFFKELVKKEYIEKNPLKVFESLYSVVSDRKAHPKEGSYTNYLFEKGLDKILKKVGEEATEIIIAAKNAESEEIKYEISDFLYHMIVLMVEKDVTWEEIAQELAQR